MMSIRYNHSKGPGTSQKLKFGICIQCLVENLELEMRDQAKWSRVEEPKEQSIKQEKG